MSQGAALIEQDILAYLHQHENKQLLRFITCGSVDDGKSTLIGRLLHDSQVILADQLAALAAESKKSGTQGGELDLALLVDGLQSEREQGITIDVAYRYFATDKRKFIIADTPGHEQYTRNMATGASTCDVAIILIDARHGVQTQTRRHSFICSLLGIKHVIVAVNKMDLVDYSKQRYKDIQADYLRFAGALTIPDIRFVPVSALKGDNVVERSANLSWFRGSTLMEYLENLEIAEPADKQDFRFPVQLVSRPHADFRGFQGSIASGEVQVGDAVRILPSGVVTTVKSIVTFAGELHVAQAPMAVTLTLSDEVDVSRGNMIVRKDELPHVSSRMRATLVWMGEAALQPHRQYDLKFSCKLTSGTIERVHHRIDVNTLAEESANALALNEIGVVDVQLNEAVAFDAYSVNKQTGGFIVIDRLSNATVAAGMIDQALPEQTSQRAPIVSKENIVWHHAAVSQRERIDHKQHQPALLWYTGLSGSGKSTIANAVDRKLFELGCHTYVLDGDNIRHGLNRDLGFDDAARAENIRRISEVAQLFVDAGLIVSSAFISPFRADRAAAREQVGPRFIEVFVDTPVAVCEQRDPKGLYKKARAGEITDFTGISSPYETPDNPELHLRTAELSVEQAADIVISYLVECGVLCN
ncbi:MAG: sulfate adenylyltransferase subunit CysN [Gammaproteobacteria bacterium]|nr:sulfate adenylyltransferase subunit CysN [Gammaproteobacteria bacterium]